MKAKARTRKRPPTIIDVAKEASVAVMTVSRVLNNHPGVKTSTREKVMSAITRIGYSPNDAARMLKGRHGRTIGFIVPDLSDFFASCFHAVQQVAIAQGYQTLVAATGRSALVESQQVESMRAHRIAGLILVSSGSDGQQLKKLQTEGIPVVALDRPLAGVETNAVLVENREGAALGVRHLIEHGHKKIACIGFDADAYTVRERMEGYRQAMRAAGLRPLVFDRINSLEDMEALVRSWAASKDRPTALFSAQRISSVRLIQALHHQKLRVPQDIAVIGFDDFELAEVLGTPLTVVGQSPTELARIAAEMVFKQIATAQENSLPPSQPAKVLFATRLILRKSCGCA